MTRKGIFKRGQPYQNEDTIIRYEQTSTTPEKVAGLGGCRGTADNQVKLYAANAIPLGVFGNQYKHPGYVSGKYDKQYAENGEPVDFFSEGNFTFEGVLDDGQSIVEGEPVQFESGTGKIQLQKANPRCGFARETKSASGADGTILVEFKPEAAVIVDETVTITAHAGTLTHTPIEIMHVEGSAGSSTGPKLVTIVDTSPAAGQVYWNKTTGLTFNTTDAITEAKVRYKHA